MMRLMKKNNVVLRENGFKTKSVNFCKLHKLFAECKKKGSQRKHYNIEENIKKSTVPD